MSPQHDLEPETDQHGTNEGAARRFLMSASVFRSRALFHQGYMRISTEQAGAKLPSYLYARTYLRRQTGHTSPEHKDPLLNVLDETI